MNSASLRVSAIVFVLGIIATPPLAVADEGMWLYNNLPKKHLKEKYGFEPTAEWADHVMKASVRFNSGGSGSFVSSNGLVITNHHVASDTLYKISTKENNYLRDGFYAKTQAEEVKSPDLELNQLIAIEDVTARVNGAVPAGAADAAAFQARQAEMAKIEEEGLSKYKPETHRCDVVTLYRGGAYHLYTYKKYTDVRVVFAPESDIAFFGGDPDNFEFPRYNLDICILRVYENDKPAKIDHYFKWSTTGAKENELVFVSGHPGSTRRLYTTAALEFQRDFASPRTLNRLWRLEVMLQQYGYNSEEATRRAKDDLFGVQNSRKARMGQAQALQNPAFMLNKQKQEESLLAGIKADPKLARFAEGWSLVAAAQKDAKELSVEFGQLERGAAFNSAVFNIARELVRIAAEDKIDSIKRLREYRASARDSLLQELLSEAPLYPDLEAAKLSDSLSNFVDVMGGGHPLVQQVLAGKGPVDRAAELINGTKLFDVSERKRLLEGGQAAIDASSDPMIALAKLVDEPARSVRKKFEERVQEVERKGYALISDALFAINGSNTYPDATFTLRLSFGPVKGYEEGGVAVPAFTTLGGAFTHEDSHGGKDPWKLPASWHNAKNQIPADTPFNFVCTADIIGGNSGSPVFNKNAEFVGIIFDGNIQSLAADYMYSDEQARAVSVHSAAITATLKYVYNAGPLAEQLGK